MLLRVHVTSGSLLSPAGWDYLTYADAQVSGEAIGSLTDFDTSSAANAALTINAPFDNAGANTGLVDQSHHGWEQEVWYRRAFSTDGVAVTFEVAGSGISPGSDYLAKIAVARETADVILYTVNGVSATYNGSDSATPITPNPPAEITATATDDGSGNGVLSFTVEPDSGSPSDFAGVSAFTITDLSTGPSISSVIDSVGSTADQITEGQNATIQLSEDATVSSAELQNSGGTRTATLTIQSSTSNSVTVQGARSALRYGDTDNKVVLILGDSSTIEATGITFAAPANVGYVNGTSIDTTSDNSFGKGMSSTPSDYQFAWTDNNGVDPTVNSDLTVSSVAQEGTVTAELYDNTDGTWGPEVSYSLELDTTVTRLATIRLGIKRSIRAGIKV